MQVTKVEICFFKPVGYSDKHYIETLHRGDAIKEVMAKYDEHHLKHINYIQADLTSKPTNDN